jgi:hypothetical protein
MLVPGWTDWINAMRANIFLIAMSAFAACLPASARADCDAYNKRFLKYKELEVHAFDEIKRVDAMKPQPKTDVGLCRAALAVMANGNVVAFNPEPTCFENKAQMDAFTDKVRSAALAAFKLAQAYCTDAEMRRPTKSTD